MLLLDFLLTALHIAVILFNLAGWAWQRTRRVHLWCIGLTTFSWIVLGAWKGWGYCFLTDWAWAVKLRLGETDLPASFIHYGLQRLGISVAAETTDTLTVVTFAVCVILTVYVNFIRPRQINK